MNGRHRVLSALRHERNSDAVPFMEIEFHIHEEFIGRRLVVGDEYASLSKKDKHRALSHDAEVMVATAQKAGHDAIRNIAGYWEEAPGVPARLWLPDLDDRIALLKELRQVGQGEFFLIDTVGCAFGIPAGNHMEGFIADLFERPDDVKARSESLLNDAIEQQKRFIDAGVDGVINMVDVAFNAGTFLSPTMMDEFFFPYFDRWVQSLKDLHVPSIWHTDGNITAILERILDSGVDAIQCIDPLAGMDILEVRKRAGGKLTLIGNMNCVTLQLGSPEDIELEARRIIEGCRDGGSFVLSACNAIYEGIPARNYERFVEAHRKFGAARGQP